jgi:hypothetical protein
LRRTSSRCQRSSVSGWTKNRESFARGISRLRPAKSARSEDRRAVGPPAVEGRPPRVEAQRLRWPDRHGRTVAGRGSGRSGGRRDEKGESHGPFSRSLPLQRKVQFNVPDEVLGTHRLAERFPGPPRSSPAALSPADSPYLHAVVLVGRVHLCPPRVGHRSSNGWRRPSWARDRSGSRGSAVASQAPGTLMT